MKMFVLIQPLLISRIVQHQVSLLIVDIIFKVIHRRMGIRNILLTKSPKRLVARITGFGPLESEVNTDKEDVSAIQYSKKSLY